jgi:hypothetical protein
MLQAQYVDWIQRQINILSEYKYPNDKSKQMAYQVGFLTSILAEAMHKDSNIAYLLKDTVNELGLNSPAK